MRCHFLKDGHIQQVMDLPYLSVAEAVEHSKEAFKAVSELFDGFEVWEGASLIYFEDWLSRPDP